CRRRHGHVEPGPALAPGRPEWGPGGFGVSNETVGREFSIDPGPSSVLVILPYGASDSPA
ncbi:MAG TPA: hypothetical protein PKW82_01840, partial [Spirochaetales bacterium]|nr:hypothetical protein [Spirochaetales bacterium]